MPLGLARTHAGVWQFRPAALRQDAQPCTRTPAPRSSSASTGRCISPRPASQPARRVASINGRLLNLSQRLVAHVTFKVILPSRSFRPRQPEESLLRRTVPRPRPPGPRPSHARSGLSTLSQTYYRPKVSLGASEASEFHLTAGFAPTCGCTSTLCWRRPTLGFETISGVTPSIGCCTSIITVNETTAVLYGQY